MLDAALGSDFTWKEQITLAAACKLVFLFRFNRYFIPNQLLTLNKAKIRPCLEYGSHLWRGTSKDSLVRCNSEENN